MTNIQFQKLTASEKRVAIAKDVIKQIRTKQVVVKAKNGYVCNLQSNHPELVRNVQSNCEVCGIGSLIVSLCKSFEPQITFDFAGERDGYYFLDDDAIRPQLEKYFSTKQLDLIEGAFEGYAPFLDDIGRAAGLFGEQYEKDELRLIKIMENIIENNGCFIPILKEKETVCEC
jgi:hypothetical protein